MAEVARAHFLGPDIQFNGRRVAPGEIAGLYTPASFMVEGGRLILNSTESGNGLHASTEIQQLVTPLAGPLAPLADREPYTQTVAGYQTWGENPNPTDKSTTPNVRSFGWNKPVLKLEFLGHAQRDVLTLPEGETQIDGPWTRKLLFVSPPKEVKVSGFSETTQDYRTWHKRTDEYQGKVQLGAYTEQHKASEQGFNVVVFVAATGPDDVIRMRGRHSEILRETNAQIAASRLAELSTFVANGGSLADENNTLHAPVIDYLGGHRLVSEWEDTDLWPTIADTYKKDWDTIRAELPKKDVKVERRKISQVMWR